jgi:hypothetical protein
VDSSTAATIGGQEANFGPVALARITTAAGL